VAKYFGTTETKQISVTKKLRADYIWGMLATILFRVFCLPVTSLKEHKD
jgi:hypothetical protein